MARRAGRRDVQHWHVVLGWACGTGYGGAIRSWAPMRGMVSMAPAPGVIELVWPVSIAHKGNGQHRAW